MFRVMDRGAMKGAQLLAAAGLLLACRETGRSRPDPITYVLPAVGLRVQAHDPVQLKVQGATTVLTLRPGARSPTRLDLVRAQRIESEGEQALTTAGSLRGRYSITRAEGGSGGAEATVRGHLRGTTSDQIWTFTCHAQAESETPESECLTLLATLRPDG